MTDTACVGFADDPGPQLAAAFRVVHQTRMHDVPILNTAIAVEAVGFAPWDAHWLGCLVTPWFMNLILLPRVAEHWVRLRPGEKHTYIFPAGAFEFIGGREESIGEYHACSLFSPMFEFADHATARQTALECLNALFDAENVAHADVSLRAASESLPEAAKEAAEREASESPREAPAGLGARLEATLSKREFLRGKFLDHDAGR
jgi:[NiFe] hydrogenase assembly HybE family chaperone